MPCFQTISTIAVSLMLLQNSRFDVTCVGGLVGVWGFFLGGRGSRALFRVQGLLGFFPVIKSISSLFWGNCSGTEDCLPNIFPTSHDCLLICLQLHIWLRCMKSLNWLGYMMQSREMCNWEEKWRPSRAGTCTVQPLLALLVAEGEQTSHSLEVGQDSWAVFSSHLLHAPVISCSGISLRRSVGFQDGPFILSFCSPRTQEAVELWYFFSSLA